MAARECPEPPPSPPRVDPATAPGSSSVLIFTACAHRPAGRRRLLRLGGFEGERSAGMARGPPSAPALGRAAERGGPPTKPPTPRPPSRWACVSSGVNLLRLQPLPAPRGWPGARVAEGSRRGRPASVLEQGQVYGPQDPAQWAALPRAKPQGGGGALWA